MTFGEKIQKLRKERGLSQKQLATLISVSRQALSKWENSASIPDTENVLRISKTFGVSIDDLLNDEYDREGDIPAAQSQNKMLAAKCGGTMRTVMGIILSCFAAAGLLTIGILSSVDPAYNTYPIEVGEAEETIVVKTGLPAFLELHQIGWLFVFCMVLFTAGILIVIYPHIRSGMVMMKAKNR